MKLFFTENITISQKLAIYYLHFICTLQVRIIYGMVVVIVTNESKNARCFCWIYLICLNAFPSISVMSLAIILSSERKAAARSPAVPCKNTPTAAAVSGE